MRRILWCRHWKFSTPGSSGSIPRTSRLATYSIPSPTTPPMPGLCWAAARCGRLRRTCAGSARCAIVTVSWRKPGSPPACSIIPPPAWPGLPTRSRPMDWRLSPARWCWRDRSSARSRLTMVRTAPWAVTSLDIFRPRSDPAMPHFTIEYSANLDGLVDIGEAVEVVRKAAVETGIFPLGGIRVRAVRCEHYVIADGNPDLGFLDMVLRLGEGRDLASRKKAGTHIFEALSAYLDPVFANGKFALSFDMQINDKETSWKRNNIHEALKLVTTH